MQYQSSASHKVDNRYRNMERATDNDRALAFLKSASERIRQQQNPNLESERRMEDRFIYANPATNFETLASFRNMFWSINNPANIREYINKCVCLFEA